MENTILYYNHEYEKKLELGKAIHEIVIKRGVRQQSLRPERKEALDLYMKESVKLFPENIELKPWQISVLEEVEIPTERKIIWVVNKGNTWLQNYNSYKYGDRRLVKGISLQT